MRNADCREQSAEPSKAEAGDGRVLVTSRGLAAALGVSLRTVERMLAAGEIGGVRVHKRPVRFHVPDVVLQLAATGLTRKNGRKAGVAAAPVSETAYARRAE